MISAGDLASFPGGSSGFNNAHLASIDLGAIVPTDVPPGTVLTINRV